MRLAHTLDSLKLIEFLKDYPGQWHSIKGDKRTARALNRCIDLHPDSIEVVRYPGRAQAQVRFNG